ncbi:MAG: hypothetical protein JST84_11185 [Acidobacteria bacterium]|nr:hypothetical protein [Acidobacteriota bacterium]
MKRLLLATLFTLIVTTLSFAQTQAPAPQLLVVRETRVKLELSQEYYTFMQQETLPAYRKAGIKQWDAYTTENFGEMKFYYIRPIASLKEFDETDALTKALGEDGRRAWTAKWLRLIVSSRGYLVQMRPTLSLMPKTSAAPKLALLVTHKIAVGRAAEFEAIVKNETVPILQKTDVKAFLVGRVSLGGDANEYLSVLRFDSYEEMEKWAVAAQLQGFGKIAEKEVGITLHRETAVFRYRPDLSIRPEPQKAEAK